MPPLALERPEAEGGVVLRSIRRRAGATARPGRPIRGSSPRSRAPLWPRHLPLKRASRSSPPAGPRSCLQGPPEVADAFRPSLRQTGDRLPCSHSRPTPGRRLFRASRRDRGQPTIMAWFNAQKRCRRSSPPSPSRGPFLDDPSWRHAIHFRRRLHPWATICSSSWRSAHAHRHRPVPCHTTSNVASRDPAAPRPTSWAAECHAQLGHRTLAGRRSMEVQRAPSNTRRIAAAQMRPGIPTHITI